MADDEDEGTQEIIRLGGTPENWEEGQRQLAERLKRIAERDKRLGKTLPADKVHGRAGRSTPRARC